MGWPLTRKTSNSTDADRDETAELDYVLAAREPHRNHPSIIRTPTLVSHFAFWTTDFSKDDPSDISANEAPSPRNSEFEEITKRIVTNIFNRCFQTEDIVKYPFSENIIQSSPAESQEFYPASLKSVFSGIKDYLTNENNAGSYEIKFYKASPLNDLERESNNDPYRFFSTDTESFDILRPNILLRIEQHREFIAYSLFLFLKDADEAPECSTSVKLLARSLFRWAYGENHRYMDLLERIENTRRENLADLQRNAFPEFYRTVYEDGFTQIDKVCFRGFRGKYDFIEDQVLIRSRAMLVNGRTFCVPDEWRTYLSTITPDHEVSKRTMAPPFRQVGEEPDENDLEKMKNLTSTNSASRVSIRSSSIPLHLLEINQHIHRENARRFMEEITGGISRKDQPQLPKVLFKHRNRDAIACLMDGGDTIYLSTLGGNVGKKPIEFHRDETHDFLINTDPLYFMLIYLSEKRWPISKLLRRILDAGTMRFAALRRLKKIRHAGKLLGQFERKFADLQYQENHGNSIWTRTGQFLDRQCKNLNIFREWYALHKKPTYITKKSHITRLKSLMHKIDEVRHPFEEGLLYRINRSRHYQSIFEAIRERLEIVPIHHWQSYNSLIESRVQLTFNYINSVRTRLLSLDNALTERMVYLSGVESEKFNRIVTFFGIPAAILGIAAAGISIIQYLSTCL